MGSSSSSFSTAGKRWHYCGRCALLRLFLPACLSVCSTAWRARTCFVKSVLINLLVSHKCVYLTITATITLLTITRKKNIKLTKKYNKTWMVARRPSGYLCSHQNWCLCLAKNNNEKKTTTKTAWWDVTEKVC